MARLIDVHPDNPQPRAIAMAADIVRSGGLLAYPTDCSYALGCRLGNSAGLERIRAIRELDARHQFTLVCRDVSQLSQFATVGNAVFRALKASTPGPFTFILPATREVPRRVQHDRKRTIGVRIPDSEVVRALLDELGEPLVSSTLLLPGDDDPITEGWVIDDRLGHQVDGVLDAGDCSPDVTTVIDLSGPEPVVVRRGAGDPSRFDW